MTIRRKFSIPIAIAAVVGVMFPTAALADDGQRIYTEEESAALWSQVEEYMQKNPLDFEGIERLTAELYDAPPLVVSISDAPEGSLSGAEAQVILDAREAQQRAEIEANASDASGPIAARSVPVDAFTVAFAWVSLPYMGYPTQAGYGTWNFRDDYVNGSDPDDVAAMRFQFGNSCLLIGDSNTMRTYLWDGTETFGLSYLNDAGLGTNAPIYGFNDGTSGFQLNIDHGSVLHVPQTNCGPQTHRGQFTFEHNQDGGGIAGLSASWAGFSVSYTGTPSTLQKSSGIADTTF